MLAILVIVFFMDTTPVRISLVSPSVDTCVADAMAAHSAIHIAGGKDITTFCTVGLVH